MSRPIVTLDEAYQWAADQAADPCTRLGHTCRCPSPQTEQMYQQYRAQRATELRTFRSLFIDDD